MPHPESYQESNPQQNAESGINYAGRIFPRSKTLKEPPNIGPTDTYADQFRPLRGRVAYNLIEGTSPFPPPSRIHEIEELLAQDHERDRHYRIVDLSPAENQVKQRFNNEHCEVFFRIGGSNAVIHDWLFTLKQDTKIWIPGPSFPEVENDILLFNWKTGSKIEYYPIDIPLEMPFDEGLDLLTKKKKSSQMENVAYLICNPGNPKGDKASLEAAREFADFAAEDDNSQVFWDEAGFDFFPDDESTVALTKELPNISVGKSLKTIEPGKRIGYVVTSTGQLAEDWRAISLRFEFPNHYQDLINAIMDNEILVPYYKETADKIAGINQRFIPALERAGYKVLDTEYPTPYQFVSTGMPGFANYLPDLNLGAVSGQEYFNSHSDVDASFFRIATPDRAILIPRIIRRLDSARLLAEQNINRNGRLNI